MSQELTLRNRESVALSPYDVVETATQQSRLLMNIVEQTKCFQVISGKKYLQVEAWETIGAFNRVHAVTESITPIMDDGVKVGYDAKVTLINQDGLLVGAAIMPCYFTENACKGKEGDAKDKACKSAAQTFATSKAYRMNYSYVAILAGYQPTPAEEMTGESVDDRPANLEHWCEEHKTKFFKKGKMQGYAHQLEGGGWHNEPVAPTFPKPKTNDLTEKLKDKLTPTLSPLREAVIEKLQRQTITLEDATEVKPLQAKQDTGEQAGEIIAEPGADAVTAENQEGKTVAGKEPQLFIDLPWLKEKLAELRWRNSEVVAWLAGKPIFKGVDLTGNLSQVVARLNREQSAFLVAEIEDRLRMQ